MQMTPCPPPSPPTMLKKNSSTTSVSDSGLLPETLLAGVDATFFAQTRSQTLLFYVFFVFVFFFHAFSSACFDPFIFARLTLPSHKRTPLIGQRDSRYPIIAHDTKHFTYCGYFSFAFICRRNLVLTQSLDRR
jgi:hypothetical protein